MIKLIAAIFLAGISAFAQTGPAGCPQTQHCALLSWTDSINPSGTTYNVWRQTGSCPATPPSNTSGFTQVNTAAITAKTFTDSTVAGGTTYCYLVTAANGSNVSGPSNDAQGAIPLLFPPQTLSIPGVQ